MFPSSSRTCTVLSEASSPISMGPSSTWPASRLASHSSSTVIARPENTVIKRLFKAHEADVSGPCHHPLTRVARAITPLRLTSPFLFRWIVTPKAVCLTAGATPVRHRVNPVVDRKTQRSQPQRPPPREVVPIWISVGTTAKKKKKWSRCHCDGARGVLAKF